MAERPELVTTFDFIEADDRRMFPGTGA